jgi:hypothetical protein
MAWWQTTRLVDQVVYFGYDEKAYKLPQILHGVARQVYDEAAFAREFLPFGDRVKAQKLTPPKLRAERHLLALDNLESVTGAALSIQHTLDEGGAGGAGAIGWQRWRVGARWFCSAHAARRHG